MRVVAFQHFPLSPLNSSMRFCAHSGVVRIHFQLICDCLCQSRRLPKIRRLGGNGFEEELNGQASLTDRSQAATPGSDSPFIGTSEPETQSPLSWTPEKASCAHPNELLVSTSVRRSFLYIVMDPCLLQLSFAWSPLGAHRLSAPSFRLSAR
jgi:hypothetical protein